MSTIDIIQKEKRRQRNQYARKLVAQRESEESKNTFTGTVLGVNAETGLVMVSIDNGGTLSCKSLTSGNLKTGSKVLVSVQGSIAWVGGMPK